MCLVRTRLYLIWVFGPNIAAVVFSLYIIFPIKSLESKFSLIYFKKKLIKSEAVLHETLFYMADVFIDHWAHARLL